MEIVADDKVIEVRMTGINKGVVVPGILQGASKEALVVAMGDDRTDEELFAALEGKGVAIHVGGGTSRADMRVPNVEAARALLATLLD